jgi:hypothetical protein
MRRGESKKVRGKAALSEGSVPYSNVPPEGASGLKLGCWLNTVSQPHTVSHTRHQADREVRHWSPRCKAFRSRRQYPKLGCRLLED